MRKYLESLLGEKTKSVLPTTSKCPRCETGVFALVKLARRGYKRVCINVVYNEQGFAHNERGCGNVDARHILSVIVE